MGETVAAWHRWQDKPGMRHTGAIWRDNKIMVDSETSIAVQSALDAVEIIGRGQFYVFCNDVMDQDEVSWSDDLLLHPKTGAYMQKSGKVVAVRVRSGRTCGFFIPARTWGFERASFEMRDTIQRIFALFGYEAITPASLSEKILRATLEERIAIYRPSVGLRKTILENSSGGRIDLAKEGSYYDYVFQYDQNKSYLYHSHYVPTPYFPPYYHPKPDVRWITDLNDPGFWQVTFVVHGEGLHPITVTGDDKSRREPREGEEITVWLWREEVIACMEKGYTLLELHQGYRWRSSSDFLLQWSDVLWSKYQSVSDKCTQKVLKTMMVSLPGRFLREPKTYILIPKSQAKNGDVAITRDWYHHEQNWQQVKQESMPNFFTDWYLREEYNKESTALTPIGSYIIMKCRMEMYQRATEEEALGNTLIASYIDCLSFKKEAHLRLGGEPGDYKQKVLKSVLIEFNRCISDKEVRAPGYRKESKKREALLERYTAVMKAK